MAKTTGTEAGDVLSDIAQNAAEGFRHARADAAEAAEKALPTIFDGMTKGIYIVSYYLSFGVVFAGEVIVDTLPEDHIIRKGLRDGAEAARKKRKEADEVAEVVEVAETVAEVV